MNAFVKLTLLLMITCACSTVENKAKQVVNKTGELAGETATEFVEGVSDGIDKALQCNIELIQTLVDEGVSTGKHFIETNSSGGQDNQLTIYLIFENGYKGTISAKAFDEQNTEIGRAIIEVAQAPGEAEYYTFSFNEKTNLDAKSKIVIN